MIPKSYLLRERVKENFPEGPVRKPAYLSVGPQWREENPNVSENLSQ